MNSFGRFFRIQVYGESHGPAVGLIVDGLPPGIALQESDFIADLERRKPGARGTTKRAETDAPKIVSGVFNQHTTGAPLHIQFDNMDARAKDYDAIIDQPRPGHADFVAAKKYHGYHDHRGGGHFSGRMTLALVATGVLAKKLTGDIRIQAKLIEAGGSTDISAAIDQAIQQGDSIGGLVECNINNVPPGLGEPFFDSFESLISHLVFSIPAIKGIAFGSGFAAAQMKGSEHNDAIIDATGKTRTNFAGGINGGISNGNEIYFRVAVKPASSITKEQHTFNFTSGQEESLRIEGRHDACIALRVPVVLEAVAAIVIAELLLAQR